MFIIILNVLLSLEKLSILCYNPMFLFCMLKFVCLRKTYILFQKDEHLNFAQDSGPVDAVSAFCL